MLGFQEVGALVRYVGARAKATARRIPVADDAKRRAPPETTEVPAFLRHFDYAAFADDIARIRLELKGHVGKEDYEHLRTVERWGRACTLLGYATAGFAPNPISAALIAQGRSVRWLIGHHVLHRCYDQVPGIPKRYTSIAFAKGWRRYVDWFNWWLPEAWVHHHTRHHKSLGEPFDTDTVERPPGESTAVRTGIVAVYALTWEWFYFSFYSLHQLRRSEDEKQRRRIDGREADIRTGEPAPSGRDSRRLPYRIGLRDYIDVRDPRVREVYRRCLLPFAIVHYVLLPAAYVPFGPWAVLSVLMNTAFAELIVNFQGFLLNRTSHAGDDVYRFSDSPTTRGEFYVRQILGTANQSSGGDWLDFVQTWTNYHIEHHLWPDIPLLRYRQAQPKLQALCLKYGLPYVQESVWTRLGRLHRFAVKRLDMRVISTAARTIPRHHHRETTRP